ncbi:unnamed protein product [Agarophyton chilense]
MTQGLSVVSRALLTAGSAAITFANPARADMLALLGDLTSGAATTQLVRRLQQSEEGRQMLTTQQPSRFPEHGSASLEALRALPPRTLGREYARFMDKHGFSPESRARVRFVQDAQQQWVLQRYRDVHDVWHVLTGLPPTLLGETAQKMFEAAHTGLPVAVLAGFAGCVRVRGDERRVLVTTLLPWALRCGRGAADLLAVRYEHYLRHDVDELRRLWRVSVPNVHVRGLRR